MTEARAWPAMSIARAHAILTSPDMPLAVETVEIDGVPTRVWKNLPPTLRAVAQAGRAHGQRIFLVHEDERITFEAFYRAVAAFAHALRADGVAKGDRVAIVMRNLPEWVVAFYAAASLGAILTPLNAWGAPAELEYGLTDSGAKVLVIDAERYARLGDGGRVEHIYVARADGPFEDPRARSMAGVLGAPETWGDLPDQALPAVQIGPDDDAVLFYTSGTTGRPKGALASQRAVNTNIFTTAAANARAFLRRGEQPPAPDPRVQRSSLISIPFFHATGCFAALNPALFTGAKLTMMRKWDPIRAFELIEREKIMQAGGVPTIAWQLVEHPARADYDLSTLVQVSYGGAPAAPELVRRLKQAFPEALFGIGWGMTETCAAVCNNNAEDYVHRPDSCGPAAAVAELQVRDPADGLTLLPTGEVGELWSKGPMNARAYWNNPEATAQTFVDGWVRTGDLARLDDEGFCFIVDRAKDMVIRGGENIYCLEVENALYDHPAVMDAAVVGRPHRTLGEEPVAVVTLKPGASADEAELRAHVTARLAAFKAPVSIRFLDEVLPRNANGKVVKADLRRLFTDEPS